MNNFYKHEVMDYRLKHNSIGLCVVYLFICIGMLESFYVQLKSIKYCICIFPFCDYFDDKIVGESARFRCVYPNNAAVY